MSQPAQAQHEAAKLAAVLADQATVFFAIHPVAGRMPGHMNVLLAEANVPYEDLKEMDAANPEFPTADVALVVGANDVTNPAARRRQSRPGRHHRSSQGPGGQLTKGREIDEDRKRRV